MGGGMSRQQLASRLLVFCNSQFTFRINPHSTTPTTVTIALNPCRPAVVLLQYFSWFAARVHQEVEGEQGQFYR